MENTRTYMFHCSDHTKILLIQHVYDYIQYINSIYQLKSSQFDTLVENKYFNGTTIDKNIYWNQIKSYKNKLIRLNSYLNYFKKQFIIEANVFDSINNDCRLHISCFL